MKTASIIQQTTEVKDPDIGKNFPLEEDDKQFIKAYNEGYQKLEGEDRLRAFRNVIRNSGKCGFANSGAKQYLVNTDPGKSYRVTVRTFWRKGIHHGQYDNAYNVEAGGRTYLGCTDSGHIPVKYYRRQVVGEV